MKFAFSTVACPDWTLERMAEVIERLGYLGVELRTFGSGSTLSACDPFLTDAGKVLTLIRGAGAEPCCIATGVSFEDPVTPPIIGHVISDTERAVRAGKEAVELAARLECPFVRVFAFDVPSGESRSSALARICSRLSKVVDAGRARGVRILIQNGGGFCTAAELAEIMDRLPHPMLFAAYDAATARLAGEDPASGFNALGDKLAAVKLRDFAGGKPCALGDGDQPCESVVRELSRRGFPGWVVYEYDRAWVSGAGDALDALRASIERLYAWAGRTSAARVATRRPGMVAV